MKYLIMILLVILMIGCTKKTEQRQPRGHAHESEEVTTEIVHDTIFVDRSTGIQTTQDGQADTNWQGTDIGWNVKAESGAPDSEVDFYIICIGGFQYYIDSKIKLMSPRVIAGPTGYMMPMKCIVNRPRE